MLSTLFGKVKLHAPPVTLVVGILAWIFGKQVSGATLQEIGMILTLVLSGAAVPPATAAVAGGVKNTLARARGRAPAATEQPPNPPQGVGP